MLEPILMKIKAKEIMSQDLITAKPEDRLSDILGKMKNHNISEMPIVEKRKFLGLVNYTVMTKRRNLPLSAQARHIMIGTPGVSAEDSILDVADALLSHDYRAVPVLSKKRLVGVVSRVDIIKAVSSIDDIRRIEIEKVMTPEPLSVGEEESIDKAFKMISDLDERIIPAIDDNGGFLGVVDIKDLSGLLEKRRSESPRDTGGRDEDGDITVKGIIKQSPTSESGANLGTVMDQMLKWGNTVIPIVEGKELQGVISQLDIMELLTTYRSREGVYVQITGLEADPEIFETLFTIIEKPMDRISHLMTPERLQVHIIERSHGHDSDGLFHIRGRLATRKKLFSSSEEGWDLYKSLEELMDHLETQVRKWHDKHTR